MVNTRLAKATTVFRGLSNVHCLGLNTGWNYTQPWSCRQWNIQRTEEPGRVTSTELATDRQSKLHGNKVINAEVFASHGLNRDCSRESKRRSRFAGNINITRMAAERQAYFYALGCTLANSTKRRRPQRLLVVNIS